MKTAPAGLTVGVPQIGHSCGGFGFRGLALAPLQQRRKDLGDDVAGPHHHHLIPHPHVLAGKVLLVVKGRGADRDAADVDRLQHREGDKVTGATDVPDYVAQLRRRRGRRELPGDRPARLTADHAQLPPQRPLVDLDHHPVDLEIERLTALLPPLAALDDGVDAGMVGGVGVDLEAALGQPGDLLDVGGGIEVAAGAEPVAPDREGAFGGQGGIELADRAGGGVAGIGEGRLAGRGAALVQRFEVGDRQVDLAADFDQLRCSLNPQRDRADRAQVLGDVLAAAAIAAGGAADQHPVLVGERDRQAVDLRLGRVAELRGADVESLQVVAKPRLPGAQLLLVSGVGEREHRLGVLDLAEALQRRRADPLGGRVGAAQLGVLGLDRPQLIEQGVVFVVADLGVIEDVVATVVVLELAAQLGGSPLGSRLAHAAGALAASIPSNPHPRSRSRPP